MDILRAVLLVISVSSHVTALASTEKLEAWIVLVMKKKYPPVTREYVALSLYCDILLLFTC